MIDQTKIEKMVEQELNKILLANKPATIHSFSSLPLSIEKNILVVFTGTDVRLPEAVAQIKKLRDRGFEFSMALCPNCIKNLGTQKFIELTGITTAIPETNSEGIVKLLNDYSGLMIATLSRNTALKISYGITDAFITQLIFLAMLSKKAVVAAKNGIDPAEGEIVKLGLPPMPIDLITSILGQLQKLERWGMHLVDVNFLAEEMEKSIKMATGTIEKVDEMTPFGTERPLITEREIRLADKAGSKKINLQKGTIVTPLARDLASQLGIILE